MADVVIVGAGIVGTSIALALERRGVRSLLLERAIPGAESSSAAAGMLAPHLEAKGADPGYALSIASLAMYRSWIEDVEQRSGVETGYLEDGAIRVLADEQDGALEEVAWQIERGVAIERIGRSDLDRLVPGLAPNLTSGVYFCGEAQVDPRLLMRALSVAAERSGVRSLSGHAVKRISGGRTVTVELDDRTLEAERVVVAAGAWTSRIPGMPIDETCVHPIRGQMLALDGGRRTLGPYVWTDRGYVVPRKDGRIVVGATLERAGFDKSVTAAGIHQLLGAAIDAFPRLGAARILETWAGLRPATTNDRPLIGETRIPGLFVASGHHRNGILQAPITAECIAAIIEGRAPPIDLAAFEVGSTLSAGGAG
jgi:glycine oxidase